MPRRSPTFKDVTKKIRRKKREILAAVMELLNLTGKTEDPLTKKAVSETKKMVRTELKRLESEALKKAE